MTSPGITSGVARKRHRAASQLLGLGAIALTALGLASESPSQRLDEARLALGGDRLLKPATTFVIRGIQRIDTRVMHATDPFEIDGELPDKFVWTNTSAQGDIVFGFLKNRLITNASADLSRTVPVTAEPGRTDTTSQRPVALPDDVQQLLVAKTYFTVVTLGLFGTSFDGHPVHVSALPGAKAETPAIGLASADGFGATLIFDPKTHLPDRLLYGVKTSDQAYFVEWRYADFRDVEGRRVPFQLTYSTGNDAAHLEPRWVYASDTVQFNTTLDPTVFTLMRKR